MSMENYKVADISQRVKTELKRLENQISKDINKEIVLVAYEKNATPSAETFE